VARASTTSDVFNAIADAHRREILDTLMREKPKAGRDHVTRHDGQESSFDKLEDYLMSLLDEEGTA
jgi:hypothetical protein